MAEEDDVTRLVRSSLEAKGVLASIRVCGRAGEFGEGEGGGAMGMQCVGRRGPPCPLLQAELLAAVFTSVDDKEREAGVHRERPAHVTALLASAEGEQPL